MSQSVQSQLPELAAIRQQMFIDGKFVDAKSGRTLPVYNPATGAEIARVPDAQAEDVDAAVRSARATFESGAWRDMLPAARERLLLRLADLIERDGEELARLETLNNGKLLMFSRMLEVGANAQWTRYMAGWATKIEGSTLDVSIPFPPGVNKIAFTGSTEVGRIIGRHCMDDMKRVSLELGGKSPVIVLDDCDPDMAVAGAAGAIFFNHGQVCTAGSRLLVHKSRYDQVMSGLAAAAEATKLGDGFDETAQMGPMVSATHRDRVVRYIESGKAEGAELLAGGAAVPGDGYFVRPTVFSNTTGRDLTISREEIFGPVVVAMPFDDLDDVARKANDSRYGLGASIWTNNLTQAYRLIPKVQAGTVWINCHNMVDPNLPFGGYKDSGVGREHGRAMIDIYTETKSVCVAY